MLAPLYFTIMCVFLVFKQYEKFSTKGFAEAVEGELSGDAEDCLMTLGKCKCVNMLKS